MAAIDKTAWPGRRQNGGEGGIRTRGSLLSYARLASEYLRPLGHLSRAASAPGHAKQLRASVYHYSIVRVAEEEGFEPPASFNATVFKTVAFDRSATPPVAGRDP